MMNRFLVASLLLVGGLGACAQQVSGVGGGLGNYPASTATLGVPVGGDCMFYVMQHAPSNVKLSNRSTGQSLYFWNRHQLPWVSWVRVPQNVQAPICLPRQVLQAALQARHTLRVHGDQHYNDLTPATLEYILSTGPVSADNPVCTGGDYWCDQFGL